MIITHETTIEEYEAWLATNPDFSSFKRAVRSTFRTIYKGIARVKMIITKKKRSCLVYKVGLVIYPVSYNPNEPLKGSDYLEWRAYVKEEVRNTANHIRRLSLFEFLNNEPWANNLYAQRLDRINKLEDSIGMESAVYQALEVLSSTTKN